MNNSKSLTCPVCRGGNFIMKYEAAYVYSYVLDSDAPGLKNTEEFLPFLFDNREQKETEQYLECGSCGAKFPCYFDEWEKGVDYKALQDVIDSRTQTYVYRTSYI